MPNGSPVFDDAGQRTDCVRHGISNGHANGDAVSPANGHKRTAANGKPEPHPAGNSSNGANNRHPQGGQRAAATSQVRALHVITTRQGFELTERLREQFGLYRAADLSLRQASQLIDELNATSSGSRA